MHATFTLVCWAPAFPKPHALAHHQEPQAAGRALAARGALAAVAGAIHTAGGDPNFPHPYPLTRQVLRRAASFSNMLESSTRANVPTDLS